MLLNLSGSSKSILVQMGVLANKVWLVATGFTQEYVIDYE